MSDNFKMEGGLKAHHRLRKQADLFQERNAVYKDNFKMVGQLMKVMFPDAPPALETADDYNRWHLFELAIVKLSRYAIHYNNGGHPDSIDDMIVYLAMVAELDAMARSKATESGPKGDDSGLPSSPTAGDAVSLSFAQGLRRAAEIFSEDESALAEEALKSSVDLSTGKTLYELRYGVDPAKEGSDRSVLSAIPARVHHNIPSVGEKFNFKLEIGQGPEKKTTYLRAEIMKILEDPNDSL